MPAAPSGFEIPARPAHAGQQANGQIGSRADEVQGIKLCLGEAAGDGGELGGAGAPGGLRVALVQPADVDEL